MNQFPWIKITPELLTRATEKAIAQGKLPNNITPEGVLTGCLGEEVFKIFFPKALRHSTKDYDFLINNKRIELKTKARNYPIRESTLLAEVNTTSNHQLNDYLVFLILEKKGPAFTFAYLIGYQTPEVYYSKAFFLKKGERHPYSRTVMFADAWNLPASELKQFTKSSLPMIHPIEQRS